MKQYKGKKWKRKRTTRLDQKCYGPPGYVHWEVSHEGTYASAELNIHDGTDTIGVAAAGYVDESRSGSREEFVKLVRSTRKLINELEDFLLAVEVELDERMDDEQVRYKEWSKYRDAELKK